MDQPWSIPVKVGRTSDPGRFLGRDEPIFMRVDTACLFFFHGDPLFFVSLEVHLKSLVHHFFRCKFLRRRLYEPRCMWLVSV